MPSLEGLSSSARGAERSVLRAPLPRRIWSIRARDVPATWNNSRSPASDGRPSVAPGGAEAAARGAAGAGGSGDALSTSRPPSRERHATQPAETATASATAGSVKAKAASVRERTSTVPWPIHATRPPPTAGCGPGAGNRAPGWVITPPAPGSWNATVAPSVLGSVAGTAKTAAAWAGAAQSAAAQAASAAASAARSARRIAGRSAIAVWAPAPRSVPASGARITTGSVRPTPKPRPTSSPSAGSPSATLTAGQRPHGEGEDEGREAEPEQDPVEAGRERQRQHAPPRLGHLAAHLRDDPRAPRLAGGGRQRDRGGDGDRGRPAGADRPPEQRQAAERRHAAGERAGRERGAGHERRAQAPGVAVRRERVDHREPARRPRAGHARDQTRGEQDGLEHQQDTLVWKYMTQNTFRPE